MTDCARCGDCCEHIWLSRQARELIEGRLADARFDPADPKSANSAFLVEHWTEVERAADGASRYSCDAFDPQARLCTAHDARPPVCRDFPWYGDQPNPHVHMSPRCSFWADIPRDQRPADARPLLPLLSA